MPARGTLLNVPITAGTIHQELGLVSIITYNPEISILKVTQGCDRTMATVNLKWRDQQLVLVNQYFKFSEDTQDDAEKLLKITEQVKRNVILVADVNAHNSLWHSRETDDKR